MTVFIRGDQKVLYIHVPKTGGNAIMNFFERNQFDVGFCDVSSSTRGLNALRTCSPQHYHGELLAKTLRLSSFTYVFMTVRNPIDRLKSEFLWRVRDPAEDPNRWAQQTLQSYKEDPFFLDNHIRPQQEFYVPGADIFRMEDGYGEDWVSRVEEKIGAAITQRTVPHTHVASEFSGRSVTAVDFNDEVTASIRSVYSTDFDRFQYQD